MNVLTSEKVILHKYQGAGNDFLIVDNREGEFEVVEGFLVRGGWKKEIKVLCDRRYGIGADGRGRIWHDHVPQPPPGAPSGA